MNRTPHAGFAQDLNDASFAQTHRCQSLTQFNFRLDASDLALITHLKMVERNHRFPS
jgi:hypothetical protein